MPIGRGPGAQQDKQPEGKSPLKTPALSTHHPSLSPATLRSQAPQQAPCHSPGRASPGSTNAAAENRRCAGWSLAGGAHSAAGKQRSSAGSKPSNAGLPRMVAGDAVRRSGRGRLRLRRPDPGRVSWGELSRRSRRAGLSERRGDERPLPPPPLPASTDAQRRLCCRPRASRSAKLPNRSTTASIGGPCSHRTCRSSPADESSTRPARQPAR